MARKTTGFFQSVGGGWSRFWNWASGTGRPQSAPKNEPPPSPGTPKLTPEERQNQRYEQMMDEVSKLTQRPMDLEEKGEYALIVLVRVLVPLVFLVAFGYEDGLFMTGFRFFTWDIPFIVIMYAIGYCLESIRVAMVYSMMFSKAAGRKSDYNKQFAVWAVMSIGCGVAQLAAALVIQAIGGHSEATGENAVSSVAHQIMQTMPMLVYGAIVIRVVLCALADWACGSFLYKKKETIEQRVTLIEAQATNYQKVTQANINANAMRDNARRFEEMTQDERDEIKELRKHQRETFDKIYKAGMRQFDQLHDDDDPYRAR